MLYIALLPLSPFKKQLSLFSYGKNNVNVATAQAVQNMLCLLLPHQKFRLLFDFKFLPEGNFENKENPIVSTVSEGKTIQFLGNKIAKYNGYLSEERPQHLAFAFIKL
jgi:hypothetical protein